MKCREVVGRNHMGHFLYCLAPAKGKTSPRCADHWPKVIK